ncbi:OmpA family protein [Aliiglaciecola sp. CAU 1673]|uniref:OmpA family protein n=1 Tax=Aliiglaciecola sp. CAU 1673 TaxID=3032595 RepID=UPI0023DB811A|nr:OmpA family protein [Aliiglaciecola sp. CAU 1673]MDF2180314.1 OmpA family protein [Aliiglaciecola sp. CAU 1673]
MKKIALCCALGLGLGYAPVLAADSQENEGWVAGFAEYYNVDFDKPLPVGGLEDGFGYGAEVGFRLSPNWATRIEWSHLDINARTGFEDESGDRIGVDALYFINGNASYVFAGVKHENLGDSYRLANLGMGHHWTLAPRWKLITEVAGYYDFGQELNDYGFKLGVAYTFGAKSAPAPVTAAPAPVMPVDSDLDGVVDAQDRCPNTPRQDKVDNVGCSIFTEKQVEIALDILFANDSYVVTNPDSAKVKEFVDFMRRFPNTQATIEGHTSLVGSDAYNQQLSEKRANAVRSLLISRYGIAAERLKAVGFGESRPLDKADNAQAHAKNRRIHANVTAMEKSKVTK